MAKCKVCGTEVSFGAAFCQSCGAKIENETAEKAKSFAEDFSEKVSDFANTTDTTSDFLPEDINSNKLMAILAYIGLLFLVPLFAAKDSKFARFHTNQGIVLAIVKYVVIAIIGILGKLPVIGLIASILGSILEVGFFALMVIGIINAVNGKAKELPVIGGFRILK